MSQLIKHTSGPVDTADPWSDDVLKRRELAKELTTALSTLTQPFVLGLHAEFGNGKTFFIDRWRQDLLNAGDVAVYFNAWETDYAAEPLIAFTAAIKKQLEDHGLTDDKEAGKALATSAGRIVARSVLPRLASLVTGGFIQASDVSALTAIANDAAGAAFDITDRAIEEVVKRHEEARGEVEHFRLILTECAQAITARESGRVNRLVIFVDELDRCRPDYAAHVLECIKHFFSVDHVVFVIAIDRHALDASIRAVYGDVINIDGYLRKFFDYHVELGHPNNEAFALLLGRAFRLEEAIPHELPDRLEFFAGLCRTLRLPLRVQEQIMSQTNFIARIYGRNRAWFMYDMILILLCIRAKDHELFNRITARRLRFQGLLFEVDSLIDPDDRSEDLNRNLQHALEILLAGFASAEDIRAEYRVLEGGPKAQHSEGVPDEERWNYESQRGILEGALRLVSEPGLARPVGPGIGRRIRFLTD